MATTSTPKSLLKQMGQIQRMERGKLCQMGSGRSGPYYNHQTWEQGRNCVRYVARHKVAALQEAIAGYQKFLQLSEAYAELIIAQTRQKPEATAAPSAHPLEKGARPVAKTA